MTIADILTTYNITQAELARQTEIPLRTIEDWKAGRRQPTAWAIRLIEFYVKNTSHC